MLTTPVFSLHLPVSALQTIKAYNHACVPVAADTSGRERRAATCRRCVRTIAYTAFAAWSPPVHDISPTWCDAAGGGDDDWGAFEEGDDTAPAAAPAPGPSQTANGFAGDAAAAAFGASDGWAGFKAGPAPLPPSANGWQNRGATAPATPATVLSTDEAGHRRGVSADRALPEDLFSEPAAPAAADAPVEAPAEDDDFGDFADAEPVPPAPAQQPTEQQPGTGSLSMGWRATGLEQHSQDAGSAAAASAGAQPPYASAAVSARTANSVPAQHAPPAVGLSALPGVQLRPPAGISSAAPSSANAARTVQHSQPAPAEDNADDGFADFGAFAEAEASSRDDSGTGVAPLDALWQSSPPLHPPTAHVSAAAPTSAVTEAQLPAVSLPTPDVPSASAEPAAAAADGGLSGLASQTAGAEAAQHRRGVSRCALSMPLRAASCRCPSLF